MQRIYAEYKSAKGNDKQCLITNQCSYEGDCPHKNMNICSNNCPYFRYYKSEGHTKRHSQYQNFATESLKVCENTKNLYFKKTMFFVIDKYLVFQELYLNDNLKNTINFEKVVGQIWGKEYSGHMKIEEFSYDVFISIYNTMNKEKYIYLPKFLVSVFANFPTYYRLFKDVYEMQNIQMQFEWKYIIDGLKNVYND